MCIVSFCSLFNWFFFGRIAEYWLGLWGLPIYYVLQNWVVNPTQSGQPKSATGPIMLPSLIFFGVSYMNSFSIYLYQVSFLLLFLATSLSYFTASIYVLSCGLPINHSLICLAHTQPIANWPPLSKLCWVWFFFFSPSYERIKFLSISLKIIATSPSQSSYFSYTYYFQGENTWHMPLKSLHVL